MSIFKPDRMINRIYDISPELLNELGTRLIILDIDNTLTTHDNPVVDENVRHWIALRRSEGYKLVILSNNNVNRVRPFAEGLGLDWEAEGRKPLSAGIKRILGRYSETPEKTLVIGDQIFTDILGGRLSHCKTILTEPIELEPMPQFRLKRTGERILFKIWKVTWHNEFRTKKEE